MQEAVLASQKPTTDSIEEEGGRAQGAYSRHTSSLSCSGKVLLGGAFLKPTCL